MKEAILYNRHDDGRVQCNLCSHRCELRDGQRGVCGVRENRRGTLVSLVYGRTISQAVDPIEKKPLMHFYPGSRSLSIATPGCNLHCRWCQNWEISQMPTEQHAIAGREASPRSIVDAALRNDCRTVAYTYTEPTVFAEYAYDVGTLAHDAGIANVFVTNGYMTREMLDTFSGVIDAANVDLKSFRNETYRRYTGASLQPVLDSLIRMKAMGVWVEVTTLVVTGVNDDPGELQEIAAFIAGQLGEDTPWHISRFFPVYKMTRARPTPVETLRVAEELGREAGLRYVYVGNVAGEENTCCHACDEVLVRRVRYSVLENRVTTGNTCPSCGARVAGVGMVG